MISRLAIAAAALSAVFAAAPAGASSHMDAPLITFDDPANTTDVYAFVSSDPRTGAEYLTTALSVYPFEEPGIGPNNYRFDDRVVYEIHVALDDSIQAGRRDLTYRFVFDTKFQNDATILQNYTGVIDPGVLDSDGFPVNQNMRQSYRVGKIDNRGARPRSSILGDGAADGLIVPPNNQGLVTPFYNLRNDGDQPAKGGVARWSALDRYTKSSIARLRSGYRSFAGQRDDGFFADIQSIFDLDFSFGATTGTATKPFDSQGGFNVHTIVLDIPMDELDGAEIVGVFATTSRIHPGARMGDFSRLRQVGRQGNPLFVEALIANRDKNRYNTTTPPGDERRFAVYAEDPELARVLGTSELIPGLLRSIFIPDMIKVDLTTGPARLAGDPDFSARSVFGGDVLKSDVQDPFGNGGFIPGGWPNGRRFGDDVLDIALIALGVAGTGPDFSAFLGDRVDENDITYNDVFPYAATPLNGRNHPGQTRAVQSGL